MKEEEEKEEEEKEENCSTTPERAIWGVKGHGSGWHTNAAW